MRKKIIDHLELYVFENRTISKQDCNEAIERLEYFVQSNLMYDIR